MNILVVGASGNLGWSLCNVLTKESHKVFALARKGKDVPEGTIKVEMDLRELDLKLLPKVDSIIYLAQSKHFREFPDKWEDIFDINIKLPLVLADWARQSGVSGFHYASSGGVYEGGMVAVRENAEININRHTDFYIASRLSAEVLLRNFSSHFKSFSLIRPFFVYGPRQPRSMLIPRLIDNVLGGKPITLAGSEGLKINPIHVEDAAHSIAKLIHISGFHSLNIAGKEILSLKEIADIIGKAVGKKPVFDIKDDKPAEIIGDISKMSELLKVPEISFEQGVKDLIVSE